MATLRSFTWVNQKELQPSLVGISEAPILRSDDTLHSVPGYDVTTQLYVEGRFPEITLPDVITLEDAKRAAEFLLSPFQEFPWVDHGLDRAGLLAYMITLALRPQLPTAPLFCFTATSPGSGKGLAVETANIIVRGRDAATMPPVQGSGGEDESRKRITALLMQGVASINLDNWTKPIGGESMNALLTTTEWTDRVLGRSETVTLPARITLAATGNNLSVAGDMTRRSLLIQLDAGVERPELRKFKETNLLHRVQQDRAALLTALFTILKGYQQAGSPGNDVNLLGRFEQWTAAVCGPIRWLGFPDPLESQERLREQDPEADNLKQLLTAWHGLLGDEWTSAGALIDAALQDGVSNFNTTDKSALEEALQEVARDGRGGINRNTLGWFLRRYTGRIADGFKLEKQPRGSQKTRKSQEYRVTVYLP